MAAKNGNLSINSENIFPIIKKWLYSDHDIFYRELISNGCDAVTKLKKLEMMGEYALPEGYQARIDVVVDPEKKTLSVTDNGLGMTAEEVDEYINQIAFSGATDFIEKYKDKSNAEQIIGHFGLGFYSSFMVADEVHIDTLSYQEGAKAVHWECDGGTEFSMEDGGRTQVGTTVTLFLNEDCLEFCNEYKAREVVKKYCAFMPVEIYLSKANNQDTQTIPAAEKLESDTVVETVKPEKEGAPEKLKIRKRPELLNETQPLWGKAPKDCAKEEYLEFYRKVFHDYKEPLFWIHLNMDYPFPMRGILYFPKINMEYESIEGTIKLYNNQVFIADNIKEVIPEFLLLLKGVIDCPDLPLNVSRSALQNDGFVKKISEYITKKVADKLSGMCKTEKEEYEKYWSDISPFIKYGCLKDDKFCEKMTDYILFKNLDGKYLTLPQCLEVKPVDTQEGETAVDQNGEKVDVEVVSGGTEEEEASEKGTASEEREASGEEKASDSEELSGEEEASDGEEAPGEEEASDGEEASGEEEASDDEEASGEEDSDDLDADKDEVSGTDKKKEKVIYYVTDEKQQSQYIHMFRAASKDAVILNHNIDQPFLSQLESKNEGIKFKRIDADLTDDFKDSTSRKSAKELKKQTKKLRKLFQEALGNDKLKVKAEKLKNEGIASVLTISEESRRMQDMMKMYSMSGMGLNDFGSEGETLILNANHPLVQYVTDQTAAVAKEDGVKMICEQLYDLAKIQNAPLDPEAMTKFITRSNKILLLFAK
ncbi:MAG: molecular chaperone HtpG [Clostridium sp.]|jgi:molecular chaperone HtpG|nr:molecular chaperone HtpG [Clostridium sp.]